MLTEEAEEIAKRVALKYSRMVGWRESFDDLAQEARIAILSALPKYRPERGELAPFLYYKARMGVLDYLRSYRYVNARKLEPIGDDIEKMGLHDPMLLELEYQEQLQLAKALVYKHRLSMEQFEENQKNQTQGATISIGPIRVGLLTFTRINHGVIIKTQGGACISVPYQDLRIVVEKLSS